MTPARKVAALRAGALVLALLALPGCSGGRGGPYWGADATITPGWERLGKAALTAATDPMTWLPATAAAGLQIGGADDDLADWGNEERPLFGARDTAEDASDWLRTGSYVLYGAAGLAAPAPEGEWLATKAKGFAVGAGALLATRGLTDAGKAAVDRERPLGQDDDSFPSGHASMTAAATRLTRETLAYYDLPRAARIGGDVALAGVALTTAWARVEAGEHHPADVLAGLALGNFLTVFATEAFLAPAGDERLALRVGAHGDGMVLQLSVGF
jgi:membrane-associated phospholipid phosphatase